MRGLARLKPERTAAHRPTARAEDEAKPTKELSFIIRRKAAPRNRPDRLFRRFGSGFFLRRLSTEITARLCQLPL